MKKLLLCTAAALALMSAGYAANAADLPAAYKAPPVAPPPAYSWTGFYFGGHIGGGWGDDRVTDIFGTVFLIPNASEFHTSGFLGGAQAGYNYQIARLVIGTEVDISAADLKGTETDAPLIFGGASNRVLTDRTDWVGTATTRIGLTFWDGRWLGYGKAGVAWAHDKYSDNVANGAGVNVFSSSPTETRQGWTVGTGVEWAFAGSWSAKLEYDYMNFGTRTVSFSAPGVVLNFPLQFDKEISMVKFGINYRFWGEEAPVMARY